MIPAHSTAAEFAIGMLAGFLVLLVIARLRWGPRLVLVLPIIAVGVLALLPQTSPWVLPPLDRMVALWLAHPVALQGLLAGKLLASVIRAVRRNG